MAKKKICFNDIIGEMTRETMGENIVGQFMQMDPVTIGTVPLRYRIIGLGFVKKMSLDEVNQMLIENRCHKLYARSLFDATLIYAFENKLGYGKWRELLDKCKDIRSNIKDYFFTEKYISLQQILSYVAQNSDTDNDNATKHYTAIIEQKIIEIEDEDLFIKYIGENIFLFSNNREKTRYYLCKYIGSYLEQKIHTFFEDYSNHMIDKEDAYENISCFKCVNKLKKKETMTKEEKTRMLYESPITFHELYQLFILHYDMIVSQDWLELQYEAMTSEFGNVEDWNEEQLSILAAKISKYNHSLKKATDKETILNYETQVYQAKEQTNSRYPGNTLVRIIKGMLDIDRTTMILFLLYLSQNTIDEQRLQNILVECGFPQLNADYDFDQFILMYVDEPDEAYELLTEQAQEFALCDENSFLYETYKQSISYNDEFEKLL